MCSKTPSCTIDKKSGEYAPIPLNIACALILYILSLYKNEYFYNFFLQNFSKIFSETYQISPLKKKFPEPPPPPIGVRIAHATEISAGAHDQ